MFLNSLKIDNYKNLKNLKLTFEKKINCFVGKNGIGKTNIIDSIYHLAFTKSYFNPSTSQNVKIGENFFSIIGDFSINERKENIHCYFKNGEKKVIKKNSKAYQKISDHIGLINLIIISPHDRDLITEGSEMRRKLLDSVIGQIDKVYLQKTIDYSKVISQRNSLLKYFFINRKFDKDTIDSYDQQLISLGTPIYKERFKFINEFIPIFKKYYNEISSGTEIVDINYKSDLNSGSFSEILNESLSKDRFLQYTSKGIHRDDLSFTIDSNKIKNFGSQGQQKSFLIALKLAQFDYYKNKYGNSPIILLDDIFDKLDQDRVRQIVQILEKNDFSQIFITDTHKDRVQDALSNSKNREEIFDLENLKINE
ncbi:MAG: DNA replication and repair protein RecF [Bacteroidota bacterium]